jgi:hypothetical protein
VGVGDPTRQIEPGRFQVQEVAVEAQCYCTALQYLAVALLWTTFLVGEEQSLRAKQVDVASGHWVQKFQPSEFVSTLAFQDAAKEIRVVIVSRLVFSVSEEVVVFGGGHFVLQDWTGAPAEEGQ